jgi:hypothetical protein
MSARKGFSVAVWILALSSAAAGQPNTADEKPAPRLDPKATQVVRQMCDYFKAAQGLSVDISRTLAMTGGGKKSEMTSVVHMAVRRPNLASVSWERGGAQAVPISGLLVCDGKNLYVSIPLLKQYTAGKAPADLGALFTSRDAMPLVADAPLFLDNLLDNDPYNSIMDGLLSMNYAGTEEIAGVRYHRVKFVQENADVEAWIASGDQPLLLKVVMDATKSLKPLQGLPADAQMLLTIRFDKWAMNPDLPDERFKFVPPEDVQKVASFFEPVAPSAVPPGK